MDDPQDDPRDDPQDDPAGLSHVAEKVLIKSWPEFSICLAFLIVNEL